MSDESRLKKRKIFKQVHVINSFGCGEYTLCGTAFDIDGFDQKETSITSLSQITCGDCHEIIRAVKELKW